MLYLLDTNVVSEFRRAKPHGGVLAWMKTVRSEDLAMSSVSAGEIQRGIEITKERDALKAAELSAWLHGLVSSLPVISLDARCMMTWAQFMHRKPATLLADAMIAATASVYNLTVVTRDISDFENFGVRVFNPFEHRSAD